MRALELNIRGKNYASFSKIFRFCVEYLNMCGQSPDTLINALISFARPDRQFNRPTARPRLIKPVTLSPNHYTYSFSLEIFICLGSVVFSLEFLVLFGFFLHYLISFLLIPRMSFSPFLKYLVIYVF
jgi:hypothetical protein